MSNPTGAEPLRMRPRTPTLFLFLGLFLLRAATRRQHPRDLKDIKPAKASCRGLTVMPSEKIRFFFVSLSPFAEILRFIG